MAIFFSRGSLVFAVLMGLLHFAAQQWKLPATRQMQVLMSLLWLVVFLTELNRSLLSKNLRPFSLLWYFVVAPGTIVHELSHLIFCWCFRVKVTKFALFSPNRNTGQLGYVEFSLSRTSWLSPFKALWVGLAPIILGPLLLVLSLYLAVPSVEIPNTNEIQSSFSSIDSLIAVVESLVESTSIALKEPHPLSYGRFALLAFAAIISIGIGPSEADLKLPYKQAAKALFPALVTVFLALACVAIFLYWPVVSIIPILVFSLVALIQLTLAFTLLLFSLPRRLLAKS